MKSLLFALVIIGVASGLQAPLHYKYKYFGSVSTGIPELTNQAAGWAMKAEVEVFVEKNDGIAVFKLNHVRTVEFDEKLGCDSRGDIPDDKFAYISDPDLAKTIEASFRANLYDSKDFSIEYPEDKYRWLVNLRKGIVSIFRNAAIRGNRETQTENSIEAKIKEGHIINVFDVEEETIFGKCFVQYAGHQIPHHLAIRKDVELRKQMEYDVQSKEPESSSYTAKTSKTPKKYSPKTGKKPSRKTSKTPEKYRTNVPELKDTLWKSVRSINFDKCEEIVAFQLSSMDSKEVSGGQIDWRRGRSSVSEFIIRGDSGNARLESAIVEGATTFAPFGFKTELLQGRSNQTLQLISVKSDGVVPAIPEPVQRSYTWMYEVWSFAEPPTYSKPHPWVVYTGEGDAIGRYQAYGFDYLTPEKIASFKDKIIENIKVTSLALSDLDQEEDPLKASPSTLLKTASYLFKFLSKEKVLEIFEVFFAKDLHQSDILAKKLVIDAAAASGHYQATDAIVEYIKEEKIPDLQIMTVFMTLASNAECYGSLLNILDWVLTLDIKEKPFLTSTVLINTGHLMGEMCVTPNTRNINFAGRLSGDHGCNNQLIKERFEPYIIKMLQDERDWVKIVGIQTFEAIRTPFIFTAVAPIIEGKVKCSSKLRIYAIHALEYWGLFGYEFLKKPIVDLLTDVYSDIGENVAVREAALAVASSWFPDARFYHTLARSSWREPNRRFASYISSLIQSSADAVHPFTVKQSQAAFHAVKFTKPVAFSPLTSHMFWHVTRDHYRHIVNLYGGSLQISKSVNDIIDMMGFMMYDFGGLEIIISEIHSVLETGTYFRKLSSLLHGQTKVEGIAARIAKDFYDNIEETIKSKFNEPKTKDSFDLYLLFLNHLQAFFPLNEETFHQLPISDMTSLGAFMFQLSLGYDLVLGKYLNPIDFTSFHPTELGLPLTITGSTPLVITDVSYSSFATSSKSPGLEALKKSELTIESLISVSSQYRSSIGILLPWNEKIVKAGVISSRDIALPFKKTLRGGEKPDMKNNNFIHFDIQSIYKNKFSVIRASNTPYTSVAYLYPVGEAAPKSFITRSKPKETSIPVPSAYTGLDLHLTLKSEASLIPFTFWDEDDFLFGSPQDSPFLFYAYASPTAKYWYADLEFDPAKSATKNISFVFTYAKFGKSEPESLTQETGDFYQYGQEGFDQYDQEQQSFKPTQEFQEIGGTHEVETVPYINYGDSLKQRSEKMQNHLGGDIKISSLEVHFEGGESRGYEIVFSMKSQAVTESRKVDKLQLSFIRSPIPYVDSKPASVCIDTQISSPAFSELDELELLLKDNLDKEVKVEVTLGCTGQPVFLAKASFHISDAWKAKYENQLNEYCDYDPLDPLYTFEQHALYDEMKVTYTWEEVCDHQHYPLVTKLFNTAKYFMFKDILGQRCGGPDPERKIEAYVHRCPISGNWFAEAVGGGGSKFSFENIPHSDEFDIIFSVYNHFNDFFPNHITTFNLESEECIIGVDKVRTFDGQTFGYTPSQCWTVAAKSCYRNDKMLLVRSPDSESSTPDAKYIDVSKGLVIEYIRKTLRVNGKVFDPIDYEEVKSDEGKVLVSISKKNGHYMIELGPNSYIVLQDKIEIHADYLTWGTPCGICGNNDGEPENDFVGPQSCFYNDPNLFVASWTAGSDTCDLYTLLELREAAEKYQSSEACKTVDSLYDTCPYFNHRCMSYGLKVISEDNSICVSYAPLPSCESSCDIREYETQQIMFKCWPSDHAPDILKTAVATNQEYISSSVSYEHYYEVPKFISIPTICKQF